MVKSYGKAVMGGTIVAFILSVVLSIAYSLVLCYSDVSEATMSVAGIAIFLLSVLLGSTFAAKIAGRKGLINGLAVAICFLLISAIISGMVYSNPLSMVGFIKKGAIAILGGALGGVIGIGLADHK